MTGLRRHLMLGTAGHVDHGKTALVKMLTGCETDTLAEEKQRGLTIDLGFAPCRLANERIVGVVDVPGHVDFIRNMAAGAHGIDVVIFVVAADDGIMPQTHEHLQILTLMGVRRGLVALTKIDLVDEARRQTVTEELRRLLAGTFLADAPVCPMSNVTGTGYAGFFDALNEVVDHCEDRSCGGWFRLWVEDVFTIRGAGTVITGIPTQGRVRPGDRLGLQPAGLTANVRRLQVYGVDAAEARAGECVAVNVPDLDHTQVQRGMLLTESTAVAPVTMAEEELRILNSLKGRIEDYVEAQVHVGTAAVSARLALLETAAMTAGQRQMIQLRLAEPLPLAPGERFIVRTNVGDGGVTTIGGGRILGISNTRLRRHKPWTLAALTARREALDDPTRWCELLLRESPSALSPAELAARCFRRTDEIAVILSSLQASGRAQPTRAGTWLHVDVISQTATELLAVIQAFHAANPRRTGVGRAELLASRPVDPALLDGALERLLEAGQLERQGAVLAQAGWRAQVPDRDQALLDAIAGRLRAGGWAPPSVEDLVGALGEPPARMIALLRLLAERGLVVRLDDRVWMHREAVAAGRQIARQLFARAPKFSTMEFRDALGVSRKYAVPLLDHLDRTRFTVRSGHDRTAGVEARKLLAEAGPAK